jgi:hypothetical protein
MSRVRFATARALYETFPKSVTRIAADPTDEPPIVFLKKLSEQAKLVDAVNFCAYLLPRREAVWWACGCVRSLLGEIPQSQAAGLLAAEAWVYEPDNEHRQAALDVGDQGDSNDPVNWLALAAGWSGGMLVSHPQAQTAMPTYMTPRAARIAIVLGTVKVKPAERTARIQACIAEGIKLAETGLS